MSICDGMDVKDAIAKRRSIRAYTDKKISHKIVMELIEAARLAPSGNNTQPWLYKIITSLEDKKLLKDHKIFKQSFVYTAPVIILCCSDPSMYPAEKFDKDYDSTNEFRAVRDLSLSAQNLVLRATELGLGTCYVGWMNKTKAKKIFNLPEHYIVPFVITVGYPKINPPEHKKKGIEEILLK